MFFSSSVAFILFARSLSLSFSLSCSLGHGVFPFVFFRYLKCNQCGFDEAHLETGMCSALKLSINIFNIKLSMSHLIVNFRGHAG